MRVNVPLLARDGQMPLRRATMAAANHSGPIQRSPSSSGGLSAPAVGLESPDVSSALLGASDGFSGRPAFLLVSGSRELRQVRLVEAALDEAWADARRLGFPELVVVHGAAKGADELADRWAQRRSRQGVSRRRFRADWDGPCTAGCRHPETRRKDGTRYCPAEGARRNQRMVEHVLASAPPGGAMALIFLVAGLPCRGSRDALRRVQGVGLPHRVVTANRGRL